MRRPSISATPSSSPRRSGYNALMASIKLPERKVEGKRVAIIGGGPTGIAAAYFLRPRRYRDHHLRA